MNKTKIVRMVLQIIAGVLLIALVSGIYITQLDRTISANTLNTISEMAIHDKQSIEQIIKNSWMRLEGVAVRVVRENDDAETVLRRLNMENSTNTDFRHIHLVAEDGTVFTDENTVYNPYDTDSGRDLPDGHMRTNYLANFEGEQKYIIQKVNFDDNSDTDELIYGVRLDNMTIDGHKLIGIVGIVDIKEFSKYIVFDSFIKNGRRRGYCSIINLSAKFIINNHKTSDDLAEAEGMFDLLDAGSQSQLSNDEILRKMRVSETFTFYYTDRNLSRKLVHCTPFGENINWYFLMVVDSEAFTEQTRAFVTLSVIALAVILALLVFVMLAATRERSKIAAADAKAKAQGDFLSNMSHEIRTPLNGLIGLNHLMMSHIDDPEKSEQIKTWLVKSHDTANYLLSLVNDVLDISKLRAGKVDIIKEPVNISKIIDEVYTMQAENARSRGVKLITQKDIKVPSVIGDAVRIKQILMNIVGNAAKFTPENGTINLSVSQEVNENEVKTIYSVADTGIGMSREFLDKIFDPFSQERNRNSDSVKGTGLGMSICDLLVKAMGGTISVDSEIGVGSIFTVTLPSVPAEAENEEISAPENNTPEKLELPKKKMRILVAEDNELNAEILLEILSENGFEVVHTVDGKQTVEAFARSTEGHYDVILMDMQMPVMDGCEAAREIRGLNRSDAQRVTIFACTANTFKEDRDRALESGMDDFLTKPIDVSVLYEKLAKLRL